MYSVSYEEADCLALRFLINPEGQIAVLDVGVGACDNRKLTCRIPHPLSPRLKDCGFRAQEIRAPLGVLFFRSPIVQGLEPPRTLSPKP